MVNYSDPAMYIVISGIWIIVLSFFLITFAREFRSAFKKKFFFWIMVLPIILSSVYLAGHTVYENLISDTGGPVHWHADYEVWVCGEKLDLINPSGLRNKIGSPLFHEHNDDRIHIEGTVISLHDVDLGEYFKVIGGELDSETGKLVYPIENKVVSVKDGDLCDDEAATLKVYVNGKKIDKYEDYLIYPDAFVPPGDCIMVIFDESNDEMTELLCPSWKVKGWNYEDFTRKEIAIEGQRWR